MRLDGAQRTISCPHCGEEIAIDEVIDRLLASAEDENTKLKAQLQGVSKDLVHVQRRTRTGSATEQGYARQDRFVEELQRRFPDDDIVPVPRGSRGADITQHVRRGDADFGAILWEVKTAANWGRSWPAKLAKDQEECGANVAVIVSDRLPEGIDTFGQHGDIWVTSFAAASDLALMLRELAIRSRRYEVAASNQAGSAEKIFNYVMTGNFGARIDNLAAVAANLLQELSREKRTYELRWKRTEMQIKALLHVRDEIGCDLIEAIGSDAQLPAAFSAEPLEAASEPLALTRIIEVPPQLS